MQKTACSTGLSSMTNNPFSKFLGPDLIEESIEEIAIIAEHERRSVALVGGIAMQLY